MPASQPFSFEPMLCETAERPPERREWRYEVKLDGFRAMGRKSPCRISASSGYHGVRSVICPIALKDAGAMASPRRKCL